eukprot:1149923-Pelagomonas_calceolata.AAC.6
MLTTSPTDQPAALLKSNHDTPAPTGEVMAGHWSSKQISLFVASMYSKYGQETFCVLSELQEQNSKTAHACLKMIVEHWARERGVSIPAAAHVLPGHASLGPIHSPWPIHSRPP